MIAYFKLNPKGYRSMIMAPFVIFLLGSTLAAAAQTNMSPAINASQQPDASQRVPGRQIPLSQVLAGAKGNELKDADGPLTLGLAAIGALLGMLESDRNLPGAEKFKRSELARKIANSPAANYTTEEIAIIKDRIGAVYGPEVVGAAWYLIEGVEPLDPKH